MYRPVTETLRTARVSKVVTAVVLAAFVSLTLQPLAIAANLPAAPKATPQATATDTNAQLAQALEATEAKLGELLDDFTAGRDTVPRLQDVKQLHQQLKTLDQAALQSFAEVETHIKAKALPQVILDRHTDAVKSYTQNFQTLTNALTALEAAPDNPGKKQHAEKAFNHLKEKQKKRAHTPVDPNNLPFRTPDGKVRPPHETSQAFRASLFKPEPIQLAATELTAGMLSTEMLSVAAVAAAPTPADLAPTEDVQITPEIQALAASLNNNPVKIYNWVRNNIKFLPTYGSIQGSQMTLESKQGNAFDTASLLIALLRAAGIHARYVYGTVQIPVEKVMNWVGGVTVPEAAQQLLGQGGIPNIGLTQGGKITHIKMEHVWVEAWVDFEPSRGAVHKQGDTWIPLDASYKQYSYSLPVDIQQAVPLDANKVLQDFRNSGLVNEQLKSVTRLDMSIIEREAQTYTDRVKNYMLQNYPNATSAEAIGAKLIEQSGNSVLAASLPYQLIAKGVTASSLPSEFRYRLRFSVFRNTIDYSIDNPTLVVERSLPKFIERRFTLSFLTASDADENLLVQHISQNQIDVPAYLIKVKAVVRVGDQIVSEGGDFSLGEDIITTTELVGPNQLGAKALNVRTSGDTYVTYVDHAGEGISHVFGQKIKIGLLRSKADGGVLSAREFVGGLFESITSVFFAYISATKQATAERSNIVTYRLPSFGNAGAVIAVNYLFGVPRTASMRSINIDIDHSADIVVDKSNRTDVARSFVEATGAVTSFFEHYVLNQFFQAPAGQSAVSAVQLLAFANNSGMPIYRIDSTNAASVMPLLTISTIDKQNISDALNSGREVIVHQGQITIGNFVGAGYIIRDPSTGSGSYLISGGAQGGFTDLLFTEAGFISDLYAFLTQKLFGSSLAAGGILSIAVTALDLLFSFFELLENCGPVAAALLTGLITLMVLFFNVFLITGGPIAIILKIFFRSIIQDFIQKLGTAVFADLCRKLGYRRPVDDFNRMLWMVA